MRPEQHHNLVLLEKSMSNADKAARLYVSRKGRHCHPDGDFDKARRWQPSDDEKRSCCETVRWPSRAFPYSRMLHCRSFGHVCNLFRLSSAEMKEARKILREIDPAAQKALVKREETRLNTVRLVIDSAVAAMPLREEGTVARIREYVEKVKQFPVLNRWLKMDGNDVLEEIVARMKTSGDPTSMVWLRLAEDVE